MKTAKNIISLVFLFTALFAMQACNSNKNIYIFAGDNASQAELLTIQHLKSDLNKVIGKNITVLNAGSQLPEKGLFFIVGTQNSNEIIADLSSNKTIVLSDGFPGERGGIWAKIKLDKNQDAIVLAGGDVQGTQYAVYEYCKEILNVDPLAYWNGNAPKENLKTELLNFQNKIIPPPEIPILCYFENDVDELANIKEPKLEYDWKNYTEMINSLVRIKYNAIQLFDMLGRPEFFLRPSYKKIRPDYDVRISYIDSMINYAHDMGMMVQIDMALGYKIKPMDQDKADCWEKNKQDWIDTWKYYLEETPLSKTDIFILRPRNQVWDWEYKSSCGEDKIDVFNEVYAELGDLIDKYKPGAKKVLICYHDGMEMFNADFNPPKDWIIAWSDDGNVDFEFLPESTKGYDFGTYMHAGFWLNHTIHNPYPEKIDSVMKQMVNDYGANKYCLVNGQQFRPFLLNLEAFSKVADNVNAFNGEQFYIDWATKYFGEEAGTCAIESMKKLHEAQYNRSGYVLHLWEIREAIAYLSDGPIVRPGKTTIPVEYYMVESDYEQRDDRISILKKSLAAAEEGMEILGVDNIFYHDYILLPVQIYVDLLAFEGQLHQMTKAKKQFEETGNPDFLKQAIERVGPARTALTTVYERSVNGDKNPTWKGWYDPKNRRPNNGFPTFEMLDTIEENLKSKL
ncbi:glycosyl hydrolase 115 family protein [uncultured Draconibacterium sp.]|uniref:glycosyl hydrolase 115 family protein n=1 Tax=uncultured Draconibacterium sp. TaxID=1573823 RepID=UPI0025F295B2|nr:glycosyl hydrolase 115 family protein [uncultured Draconibacterium sp.]